MGHESKLVSYLQKSGLLVDLLLLVDATDSKTKPTSIGPLMTEKLKTIDISDSAKQASKKMRDKNVSSLIVIDNYDKP